MPWRLAPDSRRLPGSFEISFLNPAPGPVQHLNANQLRRNRILTLLLLGLAIATGIVLRLIEFSTRGSLYYNEACLALNFVLRKPIDLFRPLGFEQAAAPGYLLLEHSLATALGPGEAVLRFPTLLSSIAVLVLLAILCRRLFDAWVAIIAVTLVSVSPFLILYSSLVKPYSMDAALVLWSLLCCERVLSQPERRSWIRLLVSGAIGLFFSQSLILVLIPSGFLLGVKQRLSGRSIRWALACLVVWVAVFAPLYLAIYRFEGNSSFMQGYWAPDTLSLLRPDRRRRIISIAHNIFVSSVDSLSALVLGTGVLVLAAFGVFFCMRKKGWPWTTLLLGPYLMLLIASAVGAYPIAPRVTIFAIPILVIIVSVSIRYLTSFLLRRQALKAWSPLVLVLFVAYSIRTYAASPMFRADRGISRKLIELYRHQAVCAPIYIMAAGLPVWTFYTQDIPQTPFTLIEEAAKRDHERVYRSVEKRPDCEQQYRIGCRTVLMGNMPADQITTKESDREWADDEFRRMLQLHSSEVYLFEELYSEKALRSLIDAAPRHNGRVIKLGGDESGNYLGVVQFSR